MSKLKCKNSSAGSFKSRTVKMSHKSSTRRTYKHDYLSDSSESRTENFNKIKSVFEIKRPNRSTNTIPRQAKQAPTLQHTSDDDENKVSKDRTFVRNSSSRTSSRSLNRYKKTNNRKNTKDADKNMKNTADDVAKARVVEEFRLQFDKYFENENGADNIDDRLNNDHLQTFSNVSPTELNSTEEFTQTVEDERGKFVDTHTITQDNSDKLESKLKRNKECRKTIKSFVDAESEGETETYRKSLVLEMDLEVAKMKLDGFIDDDDGTNIDSVEENVANRFPSRVNVSRYKLLFEGMFKDFDKNVQMIENEYGTRPNLALDNRKVEGEVSVGRELRDDKIGLHNGRDERTEGNQNEFTTDEKCTQLSSVNLEDDFCESLGDDLENGSYFVEAYNDEGRELVIVEISLERRTVNFDKPLSMAKLKKSIKNSDMVFQENDDKSLNVIDDPKYFVSSGFSRDPDSNRSTVYSSSRDSEVFDTDDEGISLGNLEQRTALDENAYNNVRRETFCDDRGIVRIERVGYPEIVSGPSFEDGDLQSPVSRNNSFLQKGTLSYIIDEMKATEKKYVEDLRKVVHKYMPFVAKHCPPNLMAKRCYIFGNIESIYEHQKQFLAALETCGEEVDDVVGVFIDFEYLFELYPKYFNYKPRADIIIREFAPIIKQAQEKFKERLDLSSYLLTPLQRLGKYKLLLENTEKQLHKLELPTERTVTALEIIKRVMSMGNAFVAIESILDSPINKKDYGSFKMREKFTILKPRRLDAMVFLFENVVVFTVCDPRNMELYSYHNSIKMTDLRIATFEDLTIHLTDFTKAKRTSKAERFTYVLEAKTEKVKDAWRKAVEDILWDQLFKVKENTLKMYQSKEAKRSKTARSRVKSTGSSTFYID